MLTCGANEMAYQKRIHVPGGTYYTTRNAKPGRLIFRDADDYDDFEDFLRLALTATATKLLGYCWMPDSIHMLIKVHRRPVADLMRRVTRYCSQRMQAHAGTRETPFCEHLPITLIDPDEYLPGIIRYLHQLPTVAGLAKSTDDYPYTSHFAYLGHKEGLPVYTKPLLTLLRSRNFN